MFHKIYQPHPSLRGFINNIMIQWAELDRSKPKPVFPMPPLQEQVLIFYPFDPVYVEYPNEKKKFKSAPTIIVGRRVNRVNLHLGYHHCIVQVGFQPGGLYRLLSIPMNEFGADEAYESSMMLDKETNFITEQLREASSAEEMIFIVENFFFKKISSVKESLPIDKMLHQVIETGGLVNIDYMASQACVSIRQLERLFQQRIGVPPKFFARLVRFSKAWILKENHPAKRWVDIAYECGYFDQMHLIRDFKEFTGVTPTMIDSSLAATPFRLGHKPPF